MALTGEEKKSLGRRSSFRGERARLGEI
jgi:hypothetical protein